MTRKMFSSVAATAFTFIMISAIGTAPAFARKHCYASASNGTSWSTSAHAGARRMSTACRRAMRRCNRKLNRAKRRREIPRGSRTPRCSTGVASAG